MLLIYPPSARSTEAPIGIAKIAAALRAAGKEVECIDLCHEGIEFLLGLDAEGRGARDRGALKRREEAARSLGEMDSYRRSGRYIRAVNDLGRALKLASAPFGAEASLADYVDPGLSPLRRGDLIASGRSFEGNPFFSLFESRVRSALEREGDGWVGISICYLSQALNAFALAGYVKSAMPGKRIVIGGGLVTSWIAGGLVGRGPEFEGLVDLAVAGPGEGALVELLGGASASRDAIEKRLDLAPMDLEGFAGNRYFAPTPIVPYSFSSGCPWKRCVFCPERAEGMPYEGMLPAAAAARASRLAELYEPGLLHFTDSELSTPYLEALATSSPGAPWYGFARFSSKLVDPRFCSALAASGCVMLQLGLESGDQDVLDRLGKGTKLPEISAILDNLAEAGIGTYIYVLFGTPQEDRSAAMRTRDFVAARADRIGFLNVAVFNLPALSPEAARLETKEFFEGDLSLYREFRHPGGWDRPKVRRFLAEDFEGVPEIRSIVNRTPPVFSSNHAPFFLESGRPRLSEA